jgi:hypothetical protein
MHRSPDERPTGATIRAAHVNIMKNHVPTQERLFCHVHLCHMQRNDYPEADAGVQTCFMFAKPEGAEHMIAAPVRLCANHDRVMPC